MKINTKLLRKIQRVFKAEPKRLDMYSWAYSQEGRSAPACGTVGCIAGWACILNARGKTMSDRLDQIQGFAWDGTMPCKAQRLLGLTREQSRRLFYPDRWPTSFGTDYERAPSKPKRAAITIKRIDHFIKTRGCE